MILPLFAGLALSLPFLSNYLWFFLFIGLFFLLQIRSYFGFLLAGFWFFVFSLNCSYLPAVKYGGISPILFVLLFVLLCIFLSIYQFGLARVFGPKIAILILPLSELFRSYFPYGGFPWLIFGKIVANIPLFKHSLLYAGVYVQSLFVVSLVYLVNRGRFKSALMLVFFMSGLSMLAIFEKSLNQLATKELKIAIVQPAVFQPLRIDMQAYRRESFKTIELIESAVETDADIVFLPESSLSSYFSDEDDLQIQSIYQLSLKKPIVIGLIDIREGKRPYNSAYLFHQGKAIDSYDKVMLMPIGEFLPPPFEFLKDTFSIIGGLDYYRGNNIKPLSLNSLRVATPICFEVAHQSLVRELSTKAHFVAVLTNDGWFDDSACTRQHILWAKVRALELGKNVLWVNNNGFSGYINPMGRFSRSLSYMEKGIIILTLSIPK
ncbi:MAG: apolipoprotein N-acyltransferase [Aquificaceae bacterium]